MFRANRIVPLFVTGCLLATLTACGGMRDAAVRQKTSNDIKQVALGYLNYLDSNGGKAPQDEKEFLAWAKGMQPEMMPAFERLRGLGYKVYWGTQPAKLPAGASSTVLIAPADGATKGGMTGFADGATRDLTAKEFSAAAKPPETKK